MKIRKTHPGDTTSISINGADILNLLSRGLAIDNEDHIRIALNETARDLVVEHDVDNYQKGLLNNIEFLGLYGQVQRAINLVEETARDYERLAGLVPVNETVSREEMASAIEFTYKAEGLREALIHLRNALEPEKDAPDAG